MSSRSQRSASHLSLTPSDCERHQIAASHESVLVHDSATITAIARATGMAGGAARTRPIPYGVTQSNGARFRPLRRTHTLPVVRARLRLQL